jgi:hypothetical protein
MKQTTKVSNLYLKKIETAISCGKETLNYRAFSHLMFGNWCMEFKYLLIDAPYVKL